MFVGTQREEFSSTSCPNFEFFSFTLSPSPQAFPIDCALFIWVVSKTSYRSLSSSCHQSEERPAESSFQSIWYHDNIMITPHALHPAVCMKNDSVCSIFHNLNLWDLFFQIKCALIVWFNFSSDMFFDLNYWQMEIITFQTTSKLQKMNSPEIEVVQ